MNMDKGSLLEIFLQKCSRGKLTLQIDSINTSHSHFTTSSRKTYNMVQIVQKYDYFSESENKWKNTHEAILSQSFIHDNPISIFTSKSSYNQSLICSRWLYAVDSNLSYESNIISVFNETNYLYVDK